MTVAIKVENLSKKYIISHEKKTASYETFSDSLIQTGKNIGNRILHPFQRSENDPQKEEFWALKDINFEINQGDKVGIIGRNGAGKSTLLKILSRITEPTSGKIHINGRIASLLEVGTGFHPELTGRENIYLNGAILGMTRKEIKLKFDEIVAFSEVEKFLDTPVKRYSSGMYVRLAFAVAAHLESEILVVDEVLAVGDAEFQKKCMGKMDELGGEGKTVVFVSHKMSAIRNLCNRVVVVNKGKVVNSSPTDEAIDFYLSQCVKLSKGYVDLSDKKVARQGKRKLLVSLGLLEAGSEKYRRLVKTGEVLDIEVKFNVLESLVDYCFIAFCDLSGERVFSTGTHFDKTFCQKLQGMGRLICRIDEFPLVDGEYTLDIALGTKTNGNLDYVSNALSFRVELNDYFNTGEVVLPGQGSLAVKSSWSMK